MGNEKEMSEGEAMRKKQIELAIRREELKIEEAQLSIQYYEQELRRIDLATE